MSAKVFCQYEESTTLYYTNDDVEIYIKPTDCINKKQGTAKQYLFIEVLNKTSHELKISFEKELWYNNFCSTCNSNSIENSINLTIKENTTVVGSCELNNKQLSIFSKMLDLDNVRVLTKYELKNITIENNN